MSQITVRVSKGIIVSVAFLAVAFAGVSVAFAQEEYNYGWGGGDGSEFNYGWGGGDGTEYNYGWGSGGDGTEYNYGWGSGGDGSDYNYGWGTGGDGSDYNYGWGTGDGINYLDDVPVNYLDDVPDTYYNPDCGCYEEYIYEEGVAYSERSYDSAGFSQSASASMPFSFGRAPSTYYAPSYPAPRPQPFYPQPRQQQQQQQQQQQGGQPINIVNTNNNNNVNTNVNTAPVTPVYQAPVTYPVQYVYPQPVYPTHPSYPTYPTPTYNNAYCVITVSPNSVANGQAAYLTWSSSGATSAWLSDGIGQVAVQGTLPVRPNFSKTYTLTVSGYGGTNTCSVYVAVQNSYVSLSQIPYTGFDAGLLGNALYWLSLISFAVAGAYLTVYYLPRNVFGSARVPAFARSTGSGQAAPTLRARKQEAAVLETVKVPEESKAEVAEAPVETMTPSPIDVMEFLPVAPVARSTKDAMEVLPSHDGGAPRIVITRS